ncbi:MAG: ParB/RepB/Spo0J family partition protein [Bacteroidales bacterium]|jgi:ParB family chromosome partitioning protein|nr:ParB/RepB/Spo0J family partition protein [Bacteroidales bacterium]
MAKKSALGRGLGALIKQSETGIPESQANATDKIDIRKIEANPYQPRTNFDQEALKELAASIKQLGIIQPITVREIGDGRYQIISGERRYRASLIAGLTEIPAYIRHADDNSMLELALVENIQREDLDAIEVAISYQRLIDECRLTQENVSERVGKKRSTIANYLRLLKLPAEIQLAIRQGQISMGHARALVNIEQSGHQLRLLHDIIGNGLSVRQVEVAVRQINHLEPEPQQPVTVTPEPDAGNEQGTPGDNTVQTGETTAKPGNMTTEQPEGTGFPDPGIGGQQPGKEVLIYEDHQPPVYIPGTNEQHLKEKLSRCFGTRVDLKRNETGAGRVVIPFRTDAELQYILQMAEKMQDQDQNS